MVWSDALAERCENLSRARPAPGCRTEDLRSGAGQFGYIMTWRKVANLSGLEPSVYRRRFGWIAMEEDEIIQYPVEDSIDLHTFRPDEVKDLLQDYLEAASEKGFEEVRIIHGKGTGTLRRMVHAVLAGHPLVISFREAGPEAGGWGATMAVLKKKREG